jgi:hypothetical protein
MRAGIPAGRQRQWQARRVLSTPGLKGASPELLKCNRLKAAERRGTEDRQAELGRNRGTQKRFVQFLRNSVGSEHGGPQREIDVV